MNLPDSFSSFVKTNKQLLLVLVIILFGSYVYNSYQQNKVTRSVSVSGIGNKSVKPEKAIVSFSISLDAPSQAQAVSLGEQKFENILTGLSKYKPTEVNKTTYQISQSTRKIPTTTDDKKTVLTSAYEYVNAARITIDNPSEINDVIKYLYSAGAAVVTQARFVPKDEAAADREARNLAIKDAWTRANDLARASGARVGKVLSIQESSTTNAQTGTPVTDSGSSKTDTKSGASADGIQIQAGVTVVYELTAPLLPFWPF
jgi:uncharacterized protein